MKGQPALDRQEAARLDDVGHQIGADPGGAIAQFPLQARRQIGADETHQQSHGDGRRQKWPEQPPRRHAGRVHHHELGVPVELVDCVDDRDHEGDRSDDLRQDRNEQPGNAEKYQDGLSLVRDQIDLAQRMRDPDDPRQADEDQQECTEGGAENVAIDRARHAMCGRTWTVPGRRFSLNSERCRVPP